MGSAKEPASLDVAITGFLSSIPLFAQIDPAEAMDVLRLLRQVKLTSGEVLFRQGDAPGGMWVLGSGCEVSIEAAREGAAPVKLATLAAGQTVGEMALIDDSPRSATATVFSGGTAHQIDAADFDTLRGHSHPAAFKMMRRLASEMAQRLRAISVRISPQAPAQPAPPVADRFAGATKVTPEALTALPQFAEMPATVRLALAQKFREKRFDAGATLFTQGEPGDSVFVVVEGELSLRRGASAIARLTPGSMFGLVSAIDGCAHSADCRAETSVRVWRLLREDFEKLFFAGHRFAYRIVDTVARQMVARLRQLNATLLVQWAELPPDARVESDVHSARGALAQAEVDVDIVIEFEA